MFNPDNPLMRALGKLADLVILNFLTIICSIPIFTIGASITACYYCTVKITKDEESYIWKDFFKSFKLNFRQSTVIWLINLILISIYGADFLILTGGSIVDISTGIRVFILLTGVILVAFMVYVYPLQSHFENPVKITIKNAFLLALANLPYTIVFIAVTIAPIAFIFSSVFMYIVPIYVLLGVSGPIYLCSLGWKKIFAKLEGVGEKSGNTDEQKESEESEETKETE